ncbi:MAG: DUF2163 domain-containing protein [Parvularculaceae bacterium]|nr:DUF2163 domain-containing protein [Parvularculaceae bacterium]
MKIIPSATRQALSAPAAMTAVCLLIIRRDQVIVGLTEFDQDISFDGYHFRAEPGLTFEQLTKTADLAPDHAQLVSASSAQGLLSDDIARGAYEDAYAELWRVDAENPEHRLLLSVGTIGELTAEGSRIIIEFRSTKHGLSRTTGRVYQKSCDAQLGDGRCGVALAPLSVLGTVSMHDGLAIEVAAAFTQGAQRFAGGVATVEGGEHDGLSARIRVAEATTKGLALTLWQSPAVTLPVGVNIRLSPGCDKSFATCGSVFDNTDRFRGFPTIPGTDVLAVVR